MNDLLNLEELKYYRNVLQDSLEYLHNHGGKQMFTDFRTLTSVLSVFSESTFFTISFGTTALNYEYFRTSTGQSFKQFNYHELNAGTIFNAHMECTEFSNKFINEMLIAGSVQNPFKDRTVYINFRRLYNESTKIIETIKDGSIVCI